jgi:hypothetical protein
MHLDLSNALTASQNAFRISASVNQNILTVKQSGFIGMGLAAPTNNLHVLATSNPVRFEGLQSGAASDSVVTTDANGVLRKRTVTEVINANTISLKNTAITVPALSLGVSGSITVTVTGATIGDNVIVNPRADLPSGIAMAFSRVSAADTVTIGFVGTGSSVATAINFDVKVIK